MSNLSQYIPIVCFVFGVAVGVGALYFGFALGFKASYEIRTGKAGLPQDDRRPGLFEPQRKDAAEFELLDDEKGKD